jgi:hypothetical protein
LYLDQEIIIYYIRKSNQNMANLLLVKTGDYPPSHKLIRK